MASSPALDRRLLGRQLARPAAAQHGLDAGDQLLRVARLGDPVVGAGPQPAYPLGHGRGACTTSSASPGSARALADVIEPGHGGSRSARADASRRVGGVRREARGPRSPIAAPPSRRSRTVSSPLSSSISATRIGDASLSGAIVGPSVERAPPRRPATGRPGTRLSSRKPSVITRAHSRVPPPAAARAPSAAERQSSAARCT